MGPSDNGFDIRNFLPYLLNQAAETSSLKFQSYYKSRFGMLRTEWQVLFHLGRYGEMTAKEICGRARLHKTKVSRAVAALEQKSYLRRSTDSRDRRHEWLNLTKTGVAAFNDLSAAAERLDSELTKDLNSAELDFLRRCLTKIADPSGR